MKVLRTPAVAIPIKYVEVSEQTADRTSTVPTDRASQASVRISTALTAATTKAKTVARGHSVAAARNRNPALSDYTITKARVPLITKGGDYCDVTS